MNALFELKDIDRRTYEENLKSFLPDKMIDIHTHIWLNKFKKHADDEFARVVSWPALVAAQNSIEDLAETYELMFPGKKVGALCFSSIKPGDDIEALNSYTSEATKRDGYAGLIYSHPDWSGELLEEKIRSGGFLGVKAYLNFSPAYLPMAEIRIFDFFPHEHLKMLDKNGLIAMLHIPRNGRLKDPVNLAQMLEIEEKYPNIKLIIAHVGRAYCDNDIGNAFEVLKNTRNMVFDFSANTNSTVFQKLLETVGPKRVLFGSDLPILRMRMRRICKEGRYINLVPKGMYGDVSSDPNMGELDGKDAENLTFFMYEELIAFKKAAEETGLTKNDIEDVFYNNARQIMDGAGK
jgi:uncharacterized protein